MLLCAPAGIAANTESEGEHPRAEILLLWAASEPGSPEKLASRGMFPGPSTWNAPELGMLRAGWQAAVRCATGVGRQMDN